MRREKKVLNYVSHVSANDDNEPDQPDSPSLRYSLSDISADHQHLSEDLGTFSLQEAAVPRGPAIEPAGSQATKETNVPAPSVSRGGPVKRWIRRNPKVVGSVVVGGVLGVGGAAALIAAGKGALIGAGIGSALPGVGTVVGGVVGGLVGLLAGGLVGGGGAFLSGRLVHCGRQAGRSGKSHSIVSENGADNLPDAVLAASYQSADDEKLPPLLEQMLRNVVADMVRRPPQYKSVLDSDFGNPQSALARPESQVQAAGDKCLHDEENRSILRRSVRKMVRQTLATRRNADLSVDLNDEQVRTMIENAAGQCYFALRRWAEIKSPRDENCEALCRAIEDRAFQAAGDYIYAILDPTATFDQLAEAGVRLATEMRWHTRTTYKYDPSFQGRLPNQVDGLTLFRRVIDRGKALARDRIAKGYTGKEKKENLTQRAHDWRRRALPHRGQMAERDPVMAMWFAAVHLANADPAPARGQEPNAYTYCHGALGLLLRELNPHQADNITRFFHSRLECERAILEPQASAAERREIKRKKKANLAFCPLDTRKAAAEAWLQHLPQYSAARFATEYVEGSIVSASASASASTTDQGQHSERQSLQ